MDLPEYVSAADIMRTLYVSRATAYRVLQRLPKVHIGTLVRVRREDFEAALDAGRLDCIGEQYRPQGDDHGRR